MLKINKLASLISMVSIFNLCAMEDITHRAIVPHSVGQVAVLHRDKQFFVSDELKTTRIQNAFVDKDMRSLSHDKLAKYLAANYIRVNKTDDGQYVLRASGRLDAGSVSLGMGAYWVTKSVLYGLLGGAAVATVAVSAPIAAPAAAAAAAFLPGSAAIGAAAGGLAFVTTSTTVAATTATAIATTAGAAAGIGGAGAVIGLIEGASLFMGALFGMIPVI